MVTDPTVPHPAPPTIALQLCPLSARALYAELMGWMRQLRVTTLLRPDGAAYEDWEIARQLRISVEDLQAARPHLVREGFLVQDAAGGWIAPMLIEREHQKRARAARLAEFEAERLAGTIASDTTPRQYASQRNGRAGGRTPIHTPGQRMMPFPGVVHQKSMDQVRDQNPRGSSGSMDPFHGPVQMGSMDGVRDARSSVLSVCSSQEDTDRQTVQDRAGVDGVHGPGNLDPGRSARDSAVDLNRIGRRFLEMAGLPATSWGGNSTVMVQRWIETGLSEAQMAEAAERALANNSEPVRNLGWFLPVFRAAAAVQQQSGTATGSDDVTLEPEEESAFQADRKRYFEAMERRDFSVCSPKRADYRRERAA